MENSKGKVCLLVAKGEREKGLLLSGSFNVGEMGIEERVYLWCEILQRERERERVRKKDERGVGHGYLLGLKDKAGGASS